MEFIYTKRFRKSFSNIISRYPNLYLKIEDVLNDFDEKINKSKFFRKQFKYKNRKITELEFWWDWRILLEVYILEDKAYLLNIWTHASLELSSNKKIKI